MNSHRHLSTFDPAGHCIIALEIPNALTCGWRYCNASGRLFKSISLVICACWLFSTALLADNDSESLMIRCVYFMSCPVFFIVWILFRGNNTRATCAPHAPTTVPRAAWSPLLKSCYGNASRYYPIRLPCDGLCNLLPSFRPPWFLPGIHPPAFHLHSLAVKGLLLIMVLDCHRKYYERRDSDYKSDYGVDCHKASRLASSTLRAVIFSNLISSFFNSRSSFVCS